MLRQRCWTGLMMELQISDLKHNAQLNGEKHNYTIELHMKDLVHKHEVEMNDLERRYKEELDLAVKDIKREAKEVVEREQRIFSVKVGYERERISKTIATETGGFPHQPGKRKQT